MQIKLSPQRRDDTLEVTKNGDILTVNGEDFDLSPIGEGDTLPRHAINSKWFAGDVDRISGELVLTLLLPNPWNYSYEQAFPVPLVNVPDGPVIFPSARELTEAELRTIADTSGETDIVRSATLSASGGSPEESAQLLKETGMDV